VATVDHYFPMNPVGSEKSIGDLLGKAENKRRFSQVLIEQMGMLKERTKSSAPLILEDAFVATYKNALQASSYVGLAAPIRSARALLDDKKVKKSIVQKGQKDMYASLQNYLNIVEGENANFSGIEKITQDLINKLDVAILGANPWVMLKQPVSYMLASTEMDINILRKNFKFKATRAELQEIMKWQPQLRDRFQGNVTRELGEVGRVGRVLKAYTGKETASQAVMGGIRFFDQSAITSIWRSTKVEVKRNNPNLDPKSDEFMQKVADRAWEVIRKTQPTFHQKDRSDIGNIKDLKIRLLTKYSSQRNKNYMIIRRSVEKYNRSDKTKADRARLAANLTMVTVVSTAFIVAINSMRSKFYDRKDAVPLFASLVLQYVETLLGNVYFVGPVVNAFGAKMRAKNMIGFNVNDPVTSAANDLISGAYDLAWGITNLITGEEYKSGKRAGEKKWKTQIPRGVTKAFDTAFRIRGVPAANIRKFLTATGKQTGKALGFGETQDTGTIKVPKLKGTKFGVATF
jgi:hypothetical protein